MTQTDLSSQVSRVVSDLCLSYVYRPTAGSHENRQITSRKKETELGERTDDRCSPSVSFHQIPYMEPRSDGPNLGSR